MSVSENNGYIKIPKKVAGLLITILFGLLSFAVVWGMFKNKVEENADNIKALKREVVGLERMHTDLEVIKNDVSWIKSAIVNRNSKLLAKSKER